MNRVVESGTKTWSPLLSKTPAQNTWSPILAAGVPEEIREHVFLS